MAINLNIDIIERPSTDFNIECLNELRAKTFVL